MKKDTKSSLIAAFLLSLSAASTFANFNGSDDFNDNSVDLLKWGSTDETTGGVSLTETNSRIQLTAPGTGYALRTWIANAGSFTASWSVQLDVNIPTLALAVGQAYGFEVAVRNHDDATDHYEVDLELNNFGTPARQFMTVFSNNGVDAPDGASSTASTSATVRIRYDASTTTLFGDFDANGATGGYNFTNFDSRSVTPWAMNATSVFDAGVLGFSQGGAIVTAGDSIFGDNFIATPEPSSALLCLAGITVCLKRRSLRPRNRRS